MHTPAPPAGRLATALPWGIGATALIALVFFDLGPALAFNDDWVYAWSARHLSLTHHLQMFPEQSALALVQVVWGAVFTFGHPDARALRLAMVPFVLLAAWASQRQARALGAGTFWASVAAVLLLVSPIYLVGATTFMSDTVYIGLLMMVALTGGNWVAAGKSRVACLMWATLCPLQRQVGLLSPVAITVALLLRRGEHPLVRRDSYVLAGLWGAAIVAALGPVLLGWAPPTQAVRLSALLQLHLPNPLWPVIYYLPPVLGLACIPLAVALAFQPRTAFRPRLWVAGMAAALGAVGLANAGYAAAAWLGGQRYMIYPGNVWSAAGFGPLLGGEKPPIFPAALFAVIEVLTVCTFLLLLTTARRSWAPTPGTGRGAFLLMLSASQLLPLFVVQPAVEDRYYLPVIAPLVPLLAAVAARTRRPVLAGAWAIFALLAGLALYVVGEQDYQAWQVARDRAAHLAYQWAEPAQVQAGYEANGVYVEVPVFERTGRAAAADRLLEGGFAVPGPADPLLRLRFAPLGDPRPGVDYFCLRPGRIVIDRVVSGMDGG